MLDTDFPSPSDLAKFQVFHENFAGLKDKDELIDDIKAVSNIHFVKSVYSYVLIDLIQEYLSHEFFTHANFPVISLRLIMDQYYPHEKKSIKSEYNKLKDNKLFKEGYLVIPATWNPDDYLITFGLPVFSNIMNLPNLAMFIKLNKSNYEIKNDKLRFKLFSKDPYVNIGKISNETFDSIKQLVLNSSRKLEIIKEKSNILREPDIGTIIYPKKDLDDVILTQKNKQEFEETITFIDNIKIAKDWGINIAPRLLLSGEVGTGKTLTAEAIANRLGRQIYLVGSEHLVAKYLGETAQNIDKMFQYANEFSEKIILVIDEIEGIIPSRNGINGSTSNELIRAVNTFLTNMETHTDIIIVGTTNRPNSIDSAALSRFSMTIWFDYPDMEAIEQIFKLHFCKMPKYENFDILRFTKEMESAKITGRNIRDLSVLCAKQMITKKLNLSNQIFRESLTRIIASKKNSNKSID